MLFSKIVRFGMLACLVSASSAIAGGFLLPGIASAQETNLELEEQTSPEQSTNEVTNDDLRPLSQGVLSVRGGERLMDEANAAVAEQDYDLAVQKLQEARQVFNQLSNFNQQLANSFSGIDNRIAEDLRTQALETAEMRDQATYRLALVHRAQEKPELAVPLLIQIVQSQNPTRDLGRQAYQQLFELGFVDSQFPSN